MSASVILLRRLVQPIAGVLLKRWIGEVPGKVGEELLALAASTPPTNSLAATGLAESDIQRQAARQFDELAELIVKRLAPLFAQDLSRDNASVEAVAQQLAATLQACGSAKSMLDEDLQPARILAEIPEPLLHPVGFNEKESALYERALHQAVRLLVATSSSLPGFKEAAAGELLERMRSLREELTRCFDGIERIEKGVTGLNPANQYDNYEKDYREAVVRKLDYLEVFGTGLSPEARRHALSVGYISMSLESEDGSKGQAGPRPAASVLDQLKPGGHRLLIRGDAGSGKSTLLRWAAMTAAGYGRVQYDESRHSGHRRSLEDVQELCELADRECQNEASAVGAVPWHQRVPFLIRLRECQLGRLPAMDQFVEPMRSLVDKPPAGWIHSVLREGRGLFLIDGVDEVPQAGRDAMLEEIGQLAEKWGSAFFIVSTRPAPEEEERLCGLQFALAGISPMSAIDLDRFIDRWHQAVGQKMQADGRDASGLPALAVELKRELADNPPIARLATNALLASMICALHRDGEKKLPRRQHEMVETLCEILLERDRESNLDLSKFPAAYRELTYDQKKMLVQSLAGEMVEREVSVIEKKRAITLVAQGLGQCPGRHLSEAEAVLGGLIERSGVLGRVRPETLEFRHNTLKDYLAAEWYVSCDRVGDLAAMARDPGRHQVLLFAVAVRGPREFATELIRQVLPAKRTLSLSKRSKGRRARPDKVQRAREFLAVRMLAVAQFLAPELSVELDQLSRTMFPPRTFADAEGLASLGDAVVSRLAFRDGLTPREAAASVRVLRLVNTEAAHHQLEGYLDETHQEVIAELARAVNPLRLPAVRAILERGEKLPEGIREQVTDLSPLSRLIGLRSLNLGGTAVTDLSPLSGMLKLESLNLWHTGVTDLSPLSGMLKLKSLDLSGTGVTDLSPLSGMLKLKSLDLSGTGVTDLSPLREFTGLTLLYLAKVSVTDLSPLSGMLKLEYLYLRDTGVTDLSPLQALIRSGLDVHGFNPGADPTQPQRRPC